MPGTHLPNVLAARYASAAMAELWSPEHKVVLERQLWVAVLRAQRDLGLDIAQSAIDDHVAVIDKVDLASIDARERVTRHDVKARIEEFSALAGHELIHAGMTSRDLTENVEQLQVRAALHHSSMAKHEDLIRRPHGRKSVRNDDTRAAQPLEVRASRAAAPSAVATRQDRERAGRTGVPPDTGE